jgi:hypothetical protein
MKPHTYASGLCRPRLPEEPACARYRTVGSPERETYQERQLVVHRGGWEATKADLAAPGARPTESYHPVP